MNPLPSWSGYEGGCGEIECTGLKNVLIQDFTGDFLSYIGSIISNN